MTCTLFSLRLSYSGKAVHRISASAAQGAFFEGHVHAFRALGGVPTGKIRYDNLKAAVAPVVGFSRQHLAVEQSLLQPLPHDPLETGRWLTPRVDRAR